MKKQISGYFYKRRNVGGDKGSIKGFLKNYLGISYDRRYFLIDVASLNLKYAKSDTQIDDDDVHVEPVRNIKGVYKNVVTMPVKNK